MTVEVSVIVAVYNPGHHIDGLLDSLDAQSLPAGAFEVLFCDDDSTDGTRERLRAWCATRPHARVIHNTPNSGWPGRPRNLGIDYARGAYLFFADNDDELPSSALADLRAFARANDSDVVIPKTVGRGRKVPRALFRRNLEVARLGKDPILSILTPHKLFRTALIRSHGIRFPEGKVRLEDHYFVMKAFFAARTISVFVDRPGYVWVRRDDEANASQALGDARVYFDSLERVLEIVEQNTTPGDLRDKLYAHWYDTKLLGRFRHYPGYPEAFRRAAYTEIQRVCKRFDLGDRQWRWLGAQARARSFLLQHGTYEQMRTFAENDARVHMRADLAGLTWHAGCLRLALTAQMVMGDGGPVPIRSVERRRLWVADSLLPGAGIPDIDVTAGLRRGGLHVFVRDRETGEQHRAEVESHPLASQGLGYYTEAAIDPRALPADPDEGAFEVRVRLQAAGWAAEHALPVGMFGEAVGAMGARPAQPGWVWAHVNHEDAVPTLELRWGSQPPRSMWAAGRDEQA